MNFLRQSFRKLSSDRQTDRQTDRIEIIYQDALRVVKKNRTLIGGSEQDTYESLPFIEAVTLIDVFTHTYNCFVAAADTVNTVFRPTGLFQPVRLEYETHTATPTENKCMSLKPNENQVSQTVQM